MICHSAGRSAADDGPGADDAGSTCCAFCTAQMPALADVRRVGRSRDAVASRDRPAINLGVDLVPIAAARGACRIVASASEPRLSLTALQRGRRVGPVLMFKSRRCCHVSSNSVSAPPAPSALCRRRIAHVTLETQEAPVGAAYKAVLRVPHGCDGSATTAIRMRIPDGVIGVKPMPKAGWKLDTVNGKYPKPVTLNGAKISEGVTEVAWSGGKLPDAFYDEFVFTGTLADELEAGETHLFQGGAGVRERRAPLDRDSDRRRAGARRARRRRFRAGAGAEAPADSGDRRRAVRPGRIPARAAARRCCMRAQALAHASLVRAEPADGAVLAQPPAVLKLIFNEPVSPLVMRLIGPSGEVITPAVAAENSTVTLTPPPLRQGTHVLSWRVVSADGHPVGGALVFSVGAPSAPPRRGR